MNTEWPWSSPGCGTLGTEAAAAIVLLLLAFISCSSASTIHSGQDLQASIDSASVGDTILVGPGQCSPFEVNKSLTILGTGGPTVQATVQRPGMTIKADGVRISGFRIAGVGKDPASKFDYFMKNPQAAASGIDLPNAAILIQGDNITVENTSVFGAQAGAYITGSASFYLRNNTFESCEYGAEIIGCRLGRIEGCNFSSCDKAGLQVEMSQKLSILQNDIVNSVHSGLLMKDSWLCRAENNRLSGCKEGLVLWNSTLVDVAGNRADHNYYGFLVTRSNNNTLLENDAEWNSRNEIVKGFGVGISIQDNSSYNLVAKNEARGSYNGMEVTRSCKFNVFFANSAEENNHGLRMDKCRDNLIYGNSFADNKINAYENASRNIWNTTVGNYYGDYSGRDANGDGIGEIPYRLPGQGSQSFDYRPLVMPYAAGDVDRNELMAEVRKYALFGPLDDEIPAYSVKGGTIVISAKKPTSPPKWPEPPVYSGLI
jgi:nitrous oxidase accessory protein